MMPMQLPFASYVEGIAELSRLISLPLSPGIQAKPAQQGSPVQAKRRAARGTHSSLSRNLALYSSLFEFAALFPDASSEMRLGGLARQLSRSWTRPKTPHLESTSSTSHPMAGPQDSG
ncbi:hypothetical protein G7046_g770 [Stylonectria norvegica]|nr:hypothetical protein G7046_g770 [Stylonectria norvegica]